MRAPIPTPKSQFETLFDENPDYWICECQHKKVHKKHIETMCPVCRASMIDSRDALNWEVRIWAYPNKFPTEGIEIKPV